MNLKTYWVPLILGVSLWLVSCQSNKTYVPAGLTKLENAEILELARKKEIINYEKATIKNTSGVIISMDSAMAMGQTLKWAMDPYVNAQGEVIEVIIRERTPEDSLFELQMIEVFEEVYNQEPTVTIQDVDCSDLKNILTELWKKDQKNRENGIPDFDVDFKNLEVAVSIIEQCGMPTTQNVDRAHIEHLWLVFQHASNTYRKAYFHHFQDATKRGDLRASSLALMEDRILMDEGKPQIYGSQVAFDENGVNRLHPIESPEYVDQRRARVGLGPLKDYLVKFGVDFNIPQKKK